MTCHRFFLVELTWENMTDLTNSACAAVVLLKVWTKCIINISFSVSLIRTQSSGSHTHTHTITNSTQRPVGGFCTVHSPLRVGGRGVL